MISLLIIDLDDTLCDYSQAMARGKNAVSEYFKEIGVEPSAFWRVYNEIEPMLFRDFTLKRLSTADYRTRRYEDVFQRLNMIVPASMIQTLNGLYMKETNDGVRLFPDAVPFLRNMKHLGIRTAILTNGPSDGQRSKIRALELQNKVDRIFVSSDIGVAKPEPKAFEYVLKSFAVRRDTACMIGDSLPDDVVGAHNSGIKSILLDRENKHPDFEGLKASDLATTQNILFNG